MLARRSIRAFFCVSAPLVATAPVLAQPPATAAPSAAKRVYTPADFARFAPKTAFDMLAQVPSFTIRSADQERGLGQASENVLVNGQRIADKSGGAVDSGWTKHRGPRGRCPRGPPTRVRERYSRTMLTRSSAVTSA